MNAVDTIVLIYACDKSDRRRQQVAKDVLRLTNGGILLWQVAAEFIAASRKLSNQGFTPQEAWARLRTYLRLFQFVLPSRGVLDRAKLLDVDQQWSYWDAMIVAACQQPGVRRLYSEDLPGSKAPPGLEIINPFA